MKKQLVMSASLIFMCFAAACGGSSSGPSAPVNSDPVITSADSASVSENSSDVFYTATAVDAENDTVTFRLERDAQNTDSQFFTLNENTGELAFTDPPNFEAPRDSDGNNSYIVQFFAFDGSFESRLFTLTVTVTDVTEPFKTTRIATVSQPIFATALPDGTDRVVVIGKTGLITLLTPSGGTYSTATFMDIGTTISTNSERGLLGIAFSPNFTSDRAFYVNVTNTAGDTEIRRYQTVAGDLGTGDAATSDVILTVGQPRANHNAGWIGFDSGGLLYIPLGDGGGGGDPDGFAQNTNSLLGKVVRLDITADAFPTDDLRDYNIPAGNTFAGNPAAGREEIYAIGLRNPFQSSFDPATGDLIIGDVGQNAIEEIDRLPVDDNTFNFGWNQREGSQSYNGGADNAAFTLPVTEYEHGTGPTQGNSVTGGLVYSGPIDALKGQYIFADFVSNNIWTVPVA